MVHTGAWPRSTQVATQMCQPVNVNPMHKLHVGAKWNVEFTTCTNRDADVGLSHSINREDTKCVSAASHHRAAIDSSLTITTCNNDDSESPSYRVCCRRFGLLPDAQCLSWARRHFAVRLVVMYVCVGRLSSEKRDFCCKEKSVSVHFECYDC